MRLKVKDEKGNKIYVTACLWPRSRSNNISPHGCHGIRSLETLPSDYDEAESYVHRHPGCGKFDVELECHLGEAQVSYVLKKLAKAGRIAVMGRGRSRRFA
jgi:hypothetical protein